MKEETSWLQSPFILLITLNEHTFFIEKEIMKADVIVELQLALHIFVNRFDFIVAPVQIADNRILTVLFTPNMAWEYFTLS